MTIWVCYLDDEYEGCSEPYAVYDNEAAANAWVARNRYLSGARMKKMEIGVDEFS